MSKSKSKPVHEIRLGRVKAAIWANKTDKGTFYNVRFSRLYRDDDGNWCDTQNFGRDDLPLLEKVASRVHTWCFENGNQSQPSAA